MMALFPQLVKHNQAMKKEKNLSVDILSDPGNQVVALYGIKYKMADDLIKIYKQFGMKVDEYNVMIPGTFQCPHV